MTFQRNTDSGSPFSSVTAMIFLVLFFVGLYFIAKSIFWILSIIGPILLIATAIIDYKVLTGYLGWIGSLFKRNPLYGVGMSLFTIVGYPVVAAFLFVKALVKRKVNQYQEQITNEREGEYVEYEEVEEDFPEEKPFDLNIPPKLELPRKEPRKESTDYDQLFD